jgi:CheY-like chemotaxis protein
MQQNLQTHGATNREQAIVKIQTHHYDLIFMDINMPIMNGLTATYLIRGRGFCGVVTYCSGRD